MPTATRILLVEDHPVVLYGLNALIADHDGLVVVGQEVTTDQAIAAAEHREPDVVVVPIRLGGTFRGVRLCRSIKGVGAARVVVFTSFTRSIDVRAALLSGADAVVSKTAAIASIVGILRNVAAGGPPVVLAPGAAAPVIPPRHAPGQELTARELDVLELVAEGLRNEVIGERLHIGVSTVKTHVRHVLQKLGASNRRDLLNDPAGAPDEPPDPTTS